MDAEGLKKHPELLAAVRIAAAALDGWGWRGIRQSSADDTGTVDGYGPVSEEAVEEIEDACRSSGAIDGSTSYDYGDRVSDTGEAIRSLRDALR